MKDLSCAVELLARWRYTPTLVLSEVIEWKHPCELPAACSCPSYIHRANMAKLSKETKQRLQQVFQCGQFVIRWGFIPTVLYLGQYLLQEAPAPATPARMGALWHGLNTHSLITVRKGLHSVFRYSFKSSFSRISSSESSSSSETRAERFVSLKTDFVD